MSDTPWTKGNWTVCAVEDDGGPVWFEVFANGALVAAGVGSEPDAHIMSASPELFAALMGLLVLYQSQPRETTPEEVAAEYALAKARGQA